MKNVKRIVLICCVTDVVGCPKHSKLLFLWPLFDPV